MPALDCRNSRRFIPRRLLCPFRVFVMALVLPSDLLGLSWTCPVAFPAIRPPNKKAAAKGALVRAFPLGQRLCLFGPSLDLTSVHRTPFAFSCFKLRASSAEFGKARIFNALELFNGIARPRLCRMKPQFPRMFAKTLCSAQKRAKCMRGQRRRIFQPPRWAPISFGSKVGPVKAPIRSAGSPGGSDAAPRMES